MRLGCPTPPTDCCPQNPKDRTPNHDTWRLRGCFHFCCALHVESACQFELERPEYRSNAFCEGQVLELISTCSARQKWKQPRISALNIFKLVHQRTSSVRLQNMKIPRITKMTGPRKKARRRKRRDKSVRRFVHAFQKIPFSLYEIVRTSCRQEFERQTPP